MRLARLRWRLADWLRPDVWPSTHVQHGGLLADIRDLESQRQIARAGLTEIATRPKVERNPDGVDQAAWSMALIAQSTLDLMTAVSTEPPEEEGIGTVGEWTP